MRNMARKKGWILAALVFGLAGCTGLKTPLIGSYDAPYVAPVTQNNARLRQLPPPTERVPVAVYRFRDMTGQYQEAENFQQLSNAVTQGGALILIKALQDAGQRRWFKVVERNQLDDLLKERQIVTEMRRLYRGEDQIDPSVLPPLDHASILIEGGIVGYNTNVRDGGLGARYLGIGANAKYAVDEITVSLRAVSIKTGEVLHSVTARKSVYSVLLQSGVFRFIKLNELLEIEGGYVDNEPRQIAVEAAIEKAVEALIVEGAELGVWTFKDGDAGQAYIAEYRALAGRGNSLVAAAPPDTRHPTRITPTLPRRLLAKVTEPAAVTTIRRLPPPRRADEQPLG